MIKAVGMKLDEVRSFARLQTALAFEAIDVGVDLGRAATAGPALPRRTGRAAVVSRPGTAARGRRG